MHTNLVILAGGASSRMKKENSNPDINKEEVAQANERSKGLIGVGPDNRPLLDYLLYNAKKAGYKNIYIIIGEQGGLFKEFYGKKQKGNNFKGLTISFAIQYIPKGREKPFGTADALLQAVEQYPELKSESYTVCNSDNLYSLEVLYKLRETKSPNAFISYDRDTLDFSSERISRFALTKLDENNRLLDIIEKPSSTIVDNYRDTQGKLRVSMNIFKLSGQMVYKYLRNCPIHPERNEKELPSMLLNLLKDYPNSVIGIPFSEHVPDLTEKKDIAVVKEYLKNFYPQLNWNEN